MEMTISFILTRGSGRSRGRKGRRCESKPVTWMELLGK